MTNPEKLLAEPARDFALQHGKESKILSFSSADMHHLHHFPFTDLCQTWYAYDGMSVNSMSPF